MSWYSGGGGNVSPFTMVEFRVVAPVRYGETMHLVGDVPALGSGDYSHAVQLVTTPERFPEWFTKNAIPLARHEVVKYKYAVFSGGHFSRWENGRETRSLEVSDEADSQVVQDTALVSTPLTTSSNAPLSSGGSGPNTGTSLGEGTLPPVAEGEPVQEHASSSDGVQSAVQASGTSLLKGAKVSFYEESSSSSRFMKKRTLESMSGSFRDRRKKAADLDLLDGVVVVQYMLPVKITKISDSTSASMDDDGIEGKQGDYIDMGVPESFARRYPGTQAAGDGGSGTNNKPKGLASRVSSEVRKSERGLRTWVSAAATSTSPIGPGSGSKWKIEWDESALLSRKKSSVADNMRVVYIGHPNCEELILPHEQDHLAHELLRFRCVPVFLESETRDLHRLYCYEVLRKLFHHQVDVYGALPTRWWNGEMHERHWTAYRNANRSFAEKVVEVYNEGDIIWVHGNELLLLPSLLQRRLSAGKPHIGLFIHSPFPSSEIFRTLSVRDDILRGMLNADEIGFHMYEYARPFISCCHRILGIQHHSVTADKASVLGTRGVLFVDYLGRRVYITVCHAGIEPDLVRSTLASPRVFTKVKAILGAATIGGNSNSFGIEAAGAGAPESPPKNTRPAPCDNGKAQVIIVGLDAMEQLRGIHFKMAAYEAFLKEHHEWSERLCLIQVCLNVQPPTPESIEVRNVSRQLARRINDSHPRAPGMRPAVCLLEWTYCSFEDRLSLFAVADIYFNTPLRAGLDLSVFEFVVVADERRRVPGPWQRLLDEAKVCDPEVSAVQEYPAALLSEFTPSFRVLSASLKCSPWRVTDMKATLLLALSMEREERALRNRTSLDFVNRHVESGWALRVLGDIKSAHSSFDGGPDKQPEKRNEGLATSGLGFGLQFRAVEFRPDFEHLKDDMLIDCYRNSFRRLIILDYGGTTVTDEMISTGALTTPPAQADSSQKVMDPKRLDGFKFRPEGEAIVPTEQMVHALQTLVNDPCNNVFIVSGRERAELETAFADVSGIGLTAEHGCFYSWPPAKGKRRTLHQVVAAAAHGGKQYESQEEGEHLARQEQRDEATSPEQAWSSSRHGSVTPPLVAATDYNVKRRIRLRSGSLSGNNGGDAIHQHMQLHQHELGPQSSDEGAMSDATDDEHPTRRRYSRDLSPATSQHQVTQLLASGGRDIEANKFAEPLRPFRDGLTRPWMTLGEHFDDSWMDLSEQIMDVYTQRTDGTYIERKGSSIVWQFRDAEPEFGALQASELQDHLHGVLSRFPIEVVSGKGYVEVCPQGVDKGNACSHIVGMLWSSDTLPDFVLCMGDDIADEAMFEYFLQVYPSEDDEADEPRSPKRSKVFTCVVGEKPSGAQYFVNDVEEVTEILGVLARVSTRLEASRSFTNMRDLAAKTLLNNTNASGDGGDHDSRRSSGPVFALDRKYEKDTSTDGDTDADGRTDSTSGSRLTMASGSAEFSNEMLLSGSRRLGDRRSPRKLHQSFLDLRLPKELTNLQNDRRAGLNASASSPLLSSYFSLDVSQPTSHTAQEYLDTIEDDGDEGITF